MSESIVEPGLLAGRITISPSTLSRIASATVLECYGVAGIANRRILSGRAEALNHDDCERGIVIAVRDDVVTVDIFVIVDHGKRISDVARNIIHSVGAAIQHTLGDVSVRINVNVQGLRIGT